LSELLNALLRLIAQHSQVEPTVKPTVEPIVKPTVKPTIKPTIKTTLDVYLCTIRADRNQMQGKR
jgi:hypothetical protein